MGYMIAVRTYTQDEGELFAYTGEEHESKQDALREYLEASEDPAVIAAYVVLV